MLCDNILFDYDTIKLEKAFFIKCVFPIHDSLFVVYEEL